MISRWARLWTPRLFRPFINGLVRWGITPNMLTAVGLVLAVLAGVCAAAGWRLAAAFCFLLSGTLDSLDGELARQGQMQTRLGPFVDSIVDHYGDFALYLGIAWHALFSTPGDKTLVLLVLVAMFGSLVGSQIRSRAGMLGIDTKNVGIFTRAERNILLILGLVTGLLIPAFAVLALMNNLSALQRVFFVLRAGKES